MRKLLMIVMIVSTWNVCSAQNLETVLKKNSKALGLSNRKSISNLKTTGYIQMQDMDAKIPFKMVQARPDLLRVETSIFGFKAIQTYDGKTAWKLSAIDGMEAVEVDSRDMEFIAAATALDGPFSLNKDNKYTLKYNGKDSYLDKDVEVLMWSSAKERLKYYISTSSYLIDCVRYEYQKNGGWYSMEYRIKSYQNYEGSMFPNEIAVVINGVDMLTLFVSKLGPIVNFDLKKFGKPSYVM
jgi:hypothetical protein